MAFRHFPKHHQPVNSTGKDSAMSALSSGNQSAGHLSATLRQTPYCPASLTEILFIKNGERADTSLKMLYEI